MILTTLTILRKSNALSPLIFVRLAVFSLSARLETDA
jgi:hypothetical protein